VTLLRVSGLTVDFGGLRALDHIDLDVGPGEFVGLIGPNGAGKTTFIDAVSGHVRSAGEVWLDDHRIDREPPHRRSRAGLGRTFQSVELFEELSVEENLLIGATAPVTHPFAFVEHGHGRADARERVRSTMARFGLERFGEAEPTELGHGQRRLVGIARALLAAPRVLLLDEPAAGLDTFESVRLVQQLRDLRDEGLALLLVDHDMSVVLNTCERIFVLDFGRLLASGTPDEIRNDQRVVDAYLGSAPTTSSGNGSQP
jgi:branched-chain amino acid transport system ATP-binding protein